MRSMLEVSEVHTVEVGYDEFCGALAAHDLKPLWRMARQLMPEVPVPVTRPWLWRWEQVLPLAKRAGEIVTIERGGDRRVLAFANPGLNGLPYTSTTLWGAIQYLGPGENAPAHRHTPSAIRFVMTGHGVSTTVDGDACEMEPGDLILTPNWQWHDHNSSGDEPMVWFDGLDLPLVSSLEAVFFENHPRDRQPVQGRNLSEQRFTAVGLREAGAPSMPAHSPLLRYRWTETDRALESIHRLRGGLMASVEFINPLTGGPAVATFGNEMHRLFPGGRTPTRRKTGSSVYVVFRGRGRTVVDGMEMPWKAGDVFVTPSWSAVDHEAFEVSDLFAISDAPVLRALHLYREEEAAEPQPITGLFDPSR
ncbi:MAG TPA: cupin domain-containing protein [Candidatus Dormibacteraeota bacterium]|nr:cupin domain-containing protein [Candidatus Dormibacteraeota bacterium]